MKVTDVTVQKNNKHRVSVFVDNEYAFSLDETDAVLLKIKPGRELSQSELDRCIMESGFTKALGKAFDMLSRKPYSRKELADKLSQSGYDEAIVFEVAQELESLGYINDADYAALFLEHCTSKMWGKKKIRYEMKQKGLSDEIIAEVLGALDDNDTEAEMTDMILARYRGEDMTDIKTKARITRYFASRGFDFAMIDKAIRKAIEVTGNE